MKSVTSHNILNNIPIISITHKGLEAIKEIVRIAPQEAQWFHTVEPVIYKQSPNEIHLHLSEKIYIPTQNTSAAQVDTTSSMMMDFYRELKKDYEDQETVNSKLSAMTCWCHSHHNMSPNPSNQDDLQFNSFITLAEDQGTKAWQVMLIFNKKDQFYSRVYDPTTDTVHEGVPIRVVRDYDFSYIHQAARTKFIKPKPKMKKKNASGWNLGRFTSSKSFESSFFANSKDDKVLSNDLNEEIVIGVLNDIFDNYNVYMPPTQQFTKTISLHSSNLQKLQEALYATFDEREIAFFTFFITGKQKQIPSFFSDSAFTKKFPTIDKCLTFFKETLKNNTFSIQDMYEALTSTLEIVDLETRKQCKDYIDNDGII
jgi:hypothetical protein